MRAAALVLVAAIALAVAALGCGGGDPAVETPSGGCTAGTETCACGPSDACNAGLACSNGACVKCPASQADCPCVAGTCEGTLVCDTGTKKCRAPQPCACAPKQICERLDGRDAVCKPACDPGYDWNANTSKCDPKQTGTTCASSGDGAIGAQCAEVHKECKVVGSRAECGACLSGYKAQGSICVAVKQCAELNCFAQSRTCIEATTSEDARCGECVPGFVAAGTACVPASSCQTCDAQNRTCVSAGVCGDCKAGFLLVNQVCEAALTCTGAQRPSCGDRVCVEGTPARCGDACTDPTKRWNGTACVPRVTCAPGTCAANQLCVEGRDGTTGSDGGVATNAVDALCASTCPVDYGVIDGRCVQCASSVRCDTTRNFTGTVIAEGTSPGSSCFCEPAAGYFFSSTGATANQAVPCDGDGDGFTNDRVHGLLNAPDSSTRRKANCTPKQVDRAEFVFVSGASTQYAIGDAVPMSQSASGASPLPLYESARNDGEGGQSVRVTAYGSEGVEGINSLTKACGLRPGATGAPEDLDDNGAPDVAQGATGDFQGASFVVRASPLPAGLDRAASPALAALYAKYALYAHFRELYRVSVEPNVGNATTFKFVIRERPVAAGAAHRISFPEISCRRGDDPHVVNAPYDGTTTAWNRGMTRDRADISTTGATADFAWVGKGLGTFDSPTTPRFRNHLTWKCVQLVDPDLASQETAMLAEHYERVAAAGRSWGTEVNRWVRDGVNGTDFTGTKRLIEYYGTDDQSQAAAFAPAFFRPSAVFSGAVSVASVTGGLLGDVFWMAQRYVPHRAYKRTNEADPRGPWVSDYELGCINECAFDGPARCAQSRAQITVSTPPAGSVERVDGFQNSNYPTVKKPLREFLGGKAYGYLTTDDGRFACTNEAYSVWANGSAGAYRCGCSGATAGASCEQGCAVGAGVANELGVAPNFQIDTRGGMWACVAPTLTSEVLWSPAGTSFGVSRPAGVMSGSGFRLRGAVSDATFGAFASGGPGTAEAAYVTTGTRTLWSR